MAKVSLRIYCREIEGLIDRGQLDESIAHCRHILETFPKHLETYRLLGKAYLESKRYSEAVDVFSRVLMAVPDDFVSHVGMSIINDEQNKLDDAIWHMERAFESQPSNAAIQGELQRLYGRRDGVEPPKIRMTRGALAHMYVQGELYPQAVSEIRAVLNQDPQRADMQVLLARAYFRGGQKADASDICNQLLKRYPYCLDANRIIAELLPASERTENTQVYRLRVNELDPYASFAKGSIFHSDEVPDAAINLERLEYAGEAVEMGADWGSSAIGLTALTPGLEPDWLKSASQPDLQPAPASSGESDIPDFLRQAGWTEPSGEAREEQAPFAMDLEPESAADLTPANLPDWLKDQAPTELFSGISPSTTPEPVPSSSDLGPEPDWLSGLGPPPSTIETGAAYPSESEIASKPFESVESTEASVSDESIPDWLREVGAPQSSEAESKVFSEETPDWMRTLGESQGQAEPPESEIALPDWLSSQPEPPKPGRPSPLEEKPAPAPAASLETLGASAQEQDDAVAWLEMLASKHGAKPEELVTDPAARREKPPEWVEQAREIAESQPPAPKPAEPVAPFETVEPLADDSTAWLRNLAAPETHAEVPPVEETIPPADETGVWLRELSEKESFEEKEPTPPQREIPDWLAGLKSDADRAETAQPVEPVYEPIEESGFFDETESQEPRFAETASVDSVTAKSSIDLPEWLRGLDREEPAKPPKLPGEELPSWLQGDFEEQPQAEPGSPADWRPEAAESEPPVQERRYDFEPGPVPAESKRTAQPPVSGPRPESAKPKPAPPARLRHTEPPPPLPIDSILTEAQNEMDRGDIPTAMEYYGRLVKKGRYLEETIRDLRDALYRYPVEVSIWQGLGDAYMRANRLQEALDAYNKAEELLR